MTPFKIVAQNLTKTFAQGDKILTVLENISVEFCQCTSYAIIGASGSGKSTLLHMLGGLDIPSGGQVWCNNQDIASLSPSAKEQFLNRSIGFVFQFHYLLNELTVQENIILPGLIKGENKAACLQKAKTLLEHFGLEDKAHTYPYHLSGGEQQRVSILRAIFNRPAFLLADEPTGNLDAHNAAKIVQFFLQCQSEWGMGLILCSHDKEIYQKMDKIYELKNGILTCINAQF
jgi:lipoprotein-releasing system ATP-binding protein